eukprot:2675664-Amphidinium_carterae.1
MPRSPRNWPTCSLLDPPHTKVYAPPRASIRQDNHCNVATRSMRTQLHCLSDECSCAAVWAAA